jgi:hypothetical protein
MNIWSMNVRSYPQIYYTFIGDVEPMNISDYVHQFHVIDERTGELTWWPGRSHMTYMFIG